MDYAEPEVINGINLYAYCANNPVMNVDPTGNSFQGFLSILERAFSSVSSLCGYIIKHPNKFQTTFKQFHKSFSNVGRRAFYRGNNAAMNETNFLGKVWGKVATALAVATLAIDIGTSWYNNYMSGSPSWVTDSIVDTAYIGAKFAIGYAITALCNMIPVPVLGTLLGIGLAIAVNYLIDWLVGESGVLTTIKNWFADLGQQIADGWKYFWSFAWI